MYPPTNTYTYTQETEQKASSILDYLKHKVGSVVGTVPSRAGSEWGNAKIQEAELRIPSDGGEMEYIKVTGTNQSGGGQQGNDASQSIKGRMWYYLRAPFSLVSSKNRGGYDYMYGQAAGLTNAAGQTWNQALEDVRNRWESTKSSSWTSQTFDDVKREAWDTWSSTVSWPQQAAQSTADTAKRATSAVGKAAESAYGSMTQSADWAREQAASSWRDALGAAYHQWFTTKDTTQQTWDQAKKQAWKNWKATQGKAGDVYDFTTDSASSMYENALGGFYKASDVAGSGFDSARRSFNRQFGYGQQSWHDAMMSAWEQWQEEKDNSGETWDSYKNKAYDQWREQHEGKSTFQEMSDKASMGWESWMKTSWHSWKKGKEAVQGAAEGAGETAADTWAATKHKAKQ